MQQYILTQKYIFKSIGILYENYRPLVYMWLVLRKGVLYTNPILWFQGHGTQLVFDLQLWNLVEGFSYHCTNVTENFGLIAHSKRKLCLFKVAKSDVCIRPTYLIIIAYLMYICMRCAWELTTSTHRQMLSMMLFCSPTLWLPSSVKVQE